jgi:hypothetical protein
MEQKQNKDLFPGQKKGWIRFHLKYGQHEGMEQLELDLFENESDTAQ